MKLSMKMPKPGVLRLLRWPVAGLLVLAVGGAAVWFSGVVSHERLGAAWHVLRGHEEKPVEEPASAVGPEEWKSYQQARQAQARAEAESARMLEGLRDLNAVWKEQLTREQTALDVEKQKLVKEREEFEAKKLLERQELLRQKEAETLFQENVKRFQVTAPKTTAELFLSLSNAEVVKYLQSMQRELVAELFKVMQKSPGYTKRDEMDPAKPTRLEEIMRLMQTRA